MPRTNFRGTGTAAKKLVSDPSFNKSIILDSHTPVFYIQVKDSIPTLYIIRV